MAPIRAVITFMIFLMTFATAQYGPGQFTLTVYQPGSLLDGQVVNAAGEAFFLGGNPATYCPVTNQTLCPAGSQTIFAGMSAMFVEVPGGQQVYTTAAGALSFTQAHSTAELPGFYVGDFINVTTVSDCGVPVYLINWQSAPTNGIVTKGILACPKAPLSVNGTISYQIYSNIPAFNETNCTTVDGLLPHYTPKDVFGAWEYT